ncbi:MAG: beta-propeller domain-containing protein [Lachnospiraceae bacterium]|nr:beta-propeller domain-containing protein [Lachnospiraceae bacterium]
MNKEEFRQLIDEIEPESNLEQRMLEGVHTHQKKSRKTRNTILSICMVLVVLLAVPAYISGLPVPRGKENERTISDEISEDDFIRFASKKEYEKYVKDNFVEEEGDFSIFSGLRAKGNFAYAVEEAAVDYAAEDTALNPSSNENFGQTYLQVEGVDEADTLKNDGKYIYYLGSSGVRIYDKNKKLVGTISKDDFDGWIADLFRYKEQLIVIGSDNNDGQKTKVVVYDLNHIKEPKSVDTFVQSGIYTNSRRIGDMLYVVSNMNIFPGEIYPKANGKEMPVEDICCVPNPDNKSTVVVSAINLTDMSSKKCTKAIVGAGSEVYCNQDNMYLTASHYDYKKDLITSTILKIKLGKEVEFVASAKLKGEIHNQYSLDEKDGYLRVAITETSDQGKDICNLYVLDENLKTVGELKKIAVDESIKAVRYLGNVAYVITYEETDPLFCIDLKNPKNPKILGSVKISGFSSVLMPIGEDQVLGIGYYTQNEDYTDLEVQEGVKLVLFDTSDKKHPKVLDTKVYKDCYSEAQYSAKNVVLYGDDYLIPMQYNTDQGGLLQIGIEGDKLNIKTQFATDQMVTAMKVTYIDNTGYCLCDDDIDSTTFK